MSIIGVYRSVPSPQSDLYRHSLAPGSDSIALRNGIQGQAQESKMSLSSGAPIFAPSAATPVKDCAASSAANTQGDPSGATTLPKPVESGQFSTQFASTNAFVERAAVQDEKGGVVSEQNRPAESWGARSSNMSASQTAQAGREHENHGEENDEDLGEDFSNGEEGDGGQGRSAGDGGDNNKKTKRFRLTHNQTRFLMSEFTRQAHPDAAHRERLSREIPGLSPRQVQVWFQNRTQMLQQPYSSRHSANTSPTSPTTARSSFSGPKPLAVNNIKRNPGDEYPISPASAYGNYVNSPALSEPFSPTNNTGHPATLPRVPGVHPPHSHEYNRSHSFSSSYAGWQYPQRLHMPPSESGIKTEQTMNPLHRPTASYPGLAGTIPEGAPLPPAMAYQAGQPSHTNEQYPPSTESAYHTPVGYRHVLSLQTGQLPPPQEYQVSPFTPSYNFDSFYQYTHENSSTVSLPASYMRSSQQSAYEPASGTYSYENQDMSHRLSATQPGGTR
ncbi:homeobox transcription factor [Talaromyces pinophilus]|uniref:Homeobox transcription factor n=1 Tax=Talaromyces pinophilus TaxID=128442 RepID=A0A0B8N032_TALPI|nr:homeobox transcription factor [Talaromyces pinophilus]